MTSIKTKFNCKSLNIDSIQDYLKCHYIDQTCSSRTSSGNELAVLFKGVSHKDCNVKVVSVYSSLWY